MSGGGERWEGEEGGFWRKENLSFLLRTGRREEGKEAIPLTNILSKMRKEAWPAEVIGESHVNEVANGKMGKNLARFPLCTVIICLP